MHSTRPSLDYVLGLSPNLLLDYMQGRRANKQRTQSTINDEQVVQMLSSHTKQHRRSTLLNSKRSETSNEVWNAQSSQ